MTSIVKIVPLILIATTSLIACGDDSSDADVVSVESPAVVSPDIQGYYESIVTADNGDEVLLTMLVKPDGEYFGNFNNFLGNSTEFNKEIFSTYSGVFSPQNDQLATTITEFDDADFRNTIRKYPAVASYTPKQAMLLDLTNSDAAVDHDVYALSYETPELLSLQSYSGIYTNAISQVAFNNDFTTMTISETADNDTKALVIDYSDTCRFVGAITDNDYDLQFYDYEGRFSGSACPSTSSFHGVTYVINNTFIMMGTDEMKTTEMRVIKLQMIL